MTRCGGPDVYEYEFLNGLHLFLPGTITVCYCGLSPPPPPPRPPPPSPQLLRSQSCRLQPGRVVLSSSAPAKVSCFRSVSGDYFTLGAMRDAACLRLFFHCKNCVGVEMRCCFFFFFFPSLCNRGRSWSATLGRSSGTRRRGSTAPPSSAAE